jgi:hypothetical protein
MVPLGVLIAVSINSGKGSTEIATRLLEKSCNMIFTLLCLVDLPAAVLIPDKGL